MAGTAETLTAGLRRPDDMTHHSVSLSSTEMTSNSRRCLLLVSFVHGKKTSKKCKVDIS